MAEYEKAPSDVVGLALEIIESYHPGLKRAHIGLLFRDTAITRSDGSRTLGSASRVDARTAALLDSPLDFLIWLAADWWLDEADAEQRRALLDHELCHCYLDEEDRPRLRGHDIEEFAEIVERHGLDWRHDWASGRVLAVVRQAMLPFREPEYKPAGSVRAVEPEPALGL